MPKKAHKVPGAPTHSPRKNSRTRVDPADHTESTLEPSRREGEAPQMLMSPPPEETLRITRSKAASGTRTPSTNSRQDSEGEELAPSNASKRKRNLSTVSISNLPSVNAAEAAVASSSRVTLEATPNPRARKQTKLHVSFDTEADTPTKPSAKPSQPRASASPSKRSLLQSPHANNILADYIPPGSPLKRERSASRRRSTTPIPQYEPPPDRFTPPREVLYTPMPSVSKSSKRKSMTQSNVKSRRLTLQIKKEPPEIDLNEPLPPPSPTEDFLLLHGPPPSTKRKPKAPRASLASTHSRDTPPISSSPVRPSQFDNAHVQNLDFANMDVDTTDDELPLPPLFAFDKPRDPDEPWTDDEPDDGASEFDQAGEYTGKFKVFAVPTKADPPSSMTKRRQDMWGRPVSPFPRSKLLPTLRHSPIPESPQQNVDELPVAEYEDEEPQQEAAEARQPTPPQVGGLPPDPENDEPVQERHASLDHSDVLINPPEEHTEPVSANAPDAATDPPAEEPAHLNGAVSMESIIEYSVRIPSEHESSEPARVPDDAEMYHEEASRLVNSTHDAAEDADDAESVLSYVDPGELQPAPALLDSGEILSASTPVDASTETQSVDLSQPLVDSQTDEQQITPATRVELVVPPPEQAPIDVSAPTHLADAVSPAASPEHKHAELPPEAEAEPLAPSEDDDPQQEWSFGVPHTDDAEEGEMELEEEDAFSVMRELSREPSQRAEIDAEGRPAPPLLATPKLHVSPRNPFHVRTPGVAQTSGANHSDRPSESHRANTTLPVFDLPEEDPDDEALLDTSIVKITSSDPMAAARAAAILRMHKYDCVQHVPSPKHRTPFDLNSTMKSARRRSVMQSAIGKGSASARRGTLGGAIGNSMFIDGTPRTNLDELLKEAEATIIMEEGGLHGLTPPKPVAKFKTPGNVSRSEQFQAAKSTFESPSATVTGPREWSKADWKTLDSCYTEERLSIGGHSLAPVNSVDSEKVVDRFIAKLGGIALVGLGPSWTRENLLKRVRALQRKQIARNHAPPNMSFDTSAAHSWMTDNQYSTLLSPNTSILKGLDTPKEHTKVPIPMPTIHHTASSTNNSTSAEASTSLSTSTAPSSLATSVRYSQLLEGAVAVERGELSSSADEDPDASSFLPEANRSFVSPLMPGRAAHTLASKVKGLIFSYLPRSPKAAPSKGKPAPAANGPVLPVPPPEIFNKPRRPITTPAAKQPEKPAAPKDLVHLNPVPLPKPSMIPRPAQQPRRWVQLNPVSSRPSSSTGFNSNAPRERRDSGASVKDLVKTFETMEKMQVAELESQQQQNLRRKNSVKQWAEARAAKSSKPVWR